MNKHVCDRCGKEVRKRKTFNLKGKCLEISVHQTLEFPRSFSLPVTVNRKYDLCYDCMIEIEKFINKDYQVNIPHVNYRPENDTVLYICDRTACGDKCREECKHTSNIRYAANFLQLEDAYMEIDVEPDEECIDTSVVEVNPDEEI